MAQHVDQKVAVGAHAVNAGAGQRVGQHAGGLRRVGAYEMTLASIGS